jgi:hypothetical protein
MQAKDVDESKVLDLLRKNPGQWHVHWRGLPYSIGDVFQDVPAKVLVAKLNAMARKGLINGSAHSTACRGDWHVVR